MTTILLQSVSVTTIKFVTIGAVTRISPNEKYHDNYSITFDTTNVVVYYGITFGAGVSAVKHIITFIRLYTPII